MSKFVIAGSSSCPYYAKVELLADQLALNLPEFKVHKIVKHPEEWQEWLAGTCQKNGWQHWKSPIVWRELVNRGGKGVLLGGANEFQEYAQGYYGIKSPMSSQDMAQVSEENRETKLVVTREEEYEKSLSKPLHVCITNAGHPTAYHMIQAIASGRVFGAEAQISLKLLTDDRQGLDALHGMALEAQDLACSLLKEVVVTADPGRAFREASAVVFLDQLVRGEGETQADWLHRHGQRFSAYGKALDQLARPEVKVVVGGGGPLNFCTYILHHAASSIPSQNFVAVSRLEECRAKAAVARKLTVNSAEVTDLVVWGNISGTKHYDVSRAKVHSYEGAIWGPSWFSRPVVEMIHDNKWLETEFLDSLKTQDSGLLQEGLLQEGLQGPPTLSTASAILNVLIDWCNGSKGGQLFSLGVVVSEGWYDLPDDVVFSLPVKFQKGSWEVVQDLDITEALKDKLGQIAKELATEKYAMFPPPRPITPDTLEPEAGDDEAGAAKDEEKVFGQEEKSEEAEAGGSEGDKEIDARSLQTITEVEEALEADRELIDGKTSASPKPERDSGEEETSAKSGEDAGEENGSQPNPTVNDE